MFKQVVDPGNNVGLLQVGKGMGHPRKQHVEDIVRNTEPTEDSTWEPNPLPLMVRHPPRITSSNTKIRLKEDILSQPCPKGENDMGWVKPQQKPLV
jgi:hypothetical protein